MYNTNLNNTLINNKVFKLFLALGIASVVVSGVVYTVYMSNSDVCADMSYCKNYWDNYPKTCISSSDLYCCSDYYSGT